METPTSPPPSRLDAIGGWARQAYSDARVAFALDAAHRACLLLFLIMLPIREKTEFGFALGFIGLSVGAVLLAWLRRESFGVVRPFLWPVGAMLAATLASAVFSMSPSFSLEEWRKQALPFGFTFLALVLWCGADAERRLFVLRGLVLGAGIAAVGSLGGWLLRVETMVYVSSDSAGQSYLRLMGTMLSFSRMAMYCTLALPACAALGVIAWRERRRVEAVLAMGAFVLLLGTLVLTQTRGAWVGAAAGLVVFAFLYRPKILIAFVVTLVILAPLEPSVRVRASSLLRDVSNPNLLLSGRLDIWRVGVRAVAENPVLGIGYGPDIFQEKKVLAVYDITNFRRQSDLHHLYLQQLAEVGVVGVAAYAWVLAMALGPALRRRTWRDESGSPALDRLICTGAVSGVAGIAVYGLVHNFYEERNAFLFWTLVALVATSVRAVSAVPQTAAPDAKAESPAQA